jgi:iron complex transport system ATP-binding protein
MSNNKDILFTSSLSIGYKTKNAVTTIAQNLNLNLKNKEIDSLNWSKWSR